MRLELAHSSIELARPSRLGQPPAAIVALATLYAVGGRFIDDEDARLGLLEAAREALGMEIGLSGFKQAVTRLKRAGMISTRMGAGHRDKSIKLLRWSEFEEEIHALYPEATGPKYAERAGAKAVVKVEAPRIEREVPQSLDGELAVAVDRIARKLVLARLNLLEASIKDLP